VYYSIAAVEIQNFFFVKSRWTANILYCDRGTREKKFEKHCYTVYDHCRPNWA